MQAVAIPYVADEAACCRALRPVAGQSLTFVDRPQGGSALLQELHQLPLGFNEARRPRDMTQPLRCLPLKRLSTAEVSHWRRLSRLAIEPNPFQEPEFVLPWAEHHDLPDDVQLLIVPSARSDEWLAACVVQLMPATLTKPLSRLRSFRPIHSYLDHPLIDISRPEAAAQRLLTALSDCRLGHGIRMHMAQVDGPVNRLLAGEAASMGDARAFYEDNLDPRRLPSGRPAGRPAGLLLQDTAQVPAAVLAESGRDRIRQFSDHPTNLGRRSRH